MPGISKAAWSSEEDAALIALHRELGNRWSAISRSLPGRPENSVKNRFMSALRRSGMGGVDEGGEAAQVGGLLFRYIEDEARPKLTSAPPPAVDAPTEQWSPPQKGAAAGAAAAAALPFDELLDVVASGEEAAVDPELEKILRAPSESQAWQRSSAETSPTLQLALADSHLAAALGLLFPA